MDKIDYYQIVSKFAKENSLYMSCSNGIFKLGPTPISVQDYRETEAHKKEVEEFKLKNPEYAGMRGIKHKEPDSVFYNRIDLGVYGGNTKLSTFSHAQIMRRLKWLINECPYKKDNLDLLKKMYSNKYRFLEQSFLSLKFPCSSELQRLLLDLQYINEKTRRNKKYIILTEKGKNYVRELRLNEGTRKTNPTTTSATATD